MTRIELLLSSGELFDASAQQPAYDAIWLDVDNGPGGASYRDNANIDAPVGLAAALEALMPRGVCTRSGAATQSMLSSAS